MIGDALTRRRFLRNVLLASGAAALPSWVVKPAHAQTIPALVGELDVARLVSQGQLWDWQSMMVGLGPRFCGSAVHNAFIDFLEEECQLAGLHTHHDPTQHFPYWEADYTACRLALREAGGSFTDLDVMSYFPGSGNTRFLPGGGLEAELVDVGEGLPHDFAAGTATGSLSGKIAFCTEKPLPISEVLGYPHYYNDDPDGTMTPLTEWNTWALSILAPQSLVTPGLARDAGCAGMVIALEASTQCARGQFISFLSSQVVGDQTNGETGVPILFVDYHTGLRIRQRLTALESTTRTRMILPSATTPNVGSDSFVAVLPATSATHENILVTSHTDGTSASEENGPLAMISMARYFAQMPVRRRNLVLAFSTGHMNAYATDTENFLEHNEELVANTVAAMAIEHLGQRKWLDDPASNTYGDTGLNEMGVSYVSQNPLLMHSVVQNYRTEHMVRSPVMNGPGFGVSIPLFGARIPTYAYITGPSALYQMEQETVMAITDPVRMHQELRTFVRILQAWEGMSADELRAGVSLTR